MSNKHISLAPVPAHGGTRPFPTNARGLEPSPRDIALSMWGEGRDTKDIASHLGCKESWIYNQLPKWRMAAKSEVPAQ